MLLSLHIENIAIIEKSDIDFSGGFNVLTGETGAGKSIIIDSINLLLGNKAAKNLIRTGADYALVSAVFTDFNEYQKEILARNDVFPDQESNIVVSRKISVEGKNYTKINGEAVTLSTLKNIADVLVNIHGQHDGAKILDPHSHIYYLDSFCGNSDLIDAYQQKYNEVKQIRNKLAELTEIENRKQQLQETLELKISEIEKADIKIGELEKLKKASAIAQNSSIITHALGYCNSALSSSEEGNVLEIVSNMISELHSIENKLPQSKDLIESLNRAKLELEDVSESVSRVLVDYDELDLSPDYIENRIFTIERVLSKYGDEKTTLDCLADFKKEYEMLEDNEFELQNTTHQYQKQLSELEKKAENLSENRKKFAKILSDEICKQLQTLDMPNIKFEVNIERSINSRGGNKYTLLGFDSIEFLISPNAGQQLKPLSKIASGGELSRIMLCLKSILVGGKDECSTIIYDEVDSGVSGSTAQKIGMKLKNQLLEDKFFRLLILHRLLLLLTTIIKLRRTQMVV